MSLNHDKWNPSAGQGEASSAFRLGLVMFPSFVCQPALRAQIYELAYESAVMQVRAATELRWSFDPRWN
jgi:hypothetical protein